MYAATKLELTDATYVINAVQGVTFAEGTPTVDTPGGGALQGNGYVEAVDGVTVTRVSDTQIVVEIESMPAMSSLSFNVTGVLDGTGATMALDHRLVADIVGCVVPEPTETPGETTPPAETTPPVTTPGASVNVVPTSAAPQPPAGGGDDGGLAATGGDGAMLAGVAALGLLSLLGGAFALMRRRKETA